MGHNHEMCGKTCEHNNIKYCKHCQIPHCLSCGKEWGFSNKGYWLGNTVTSAGISYSAQAAKSAEMTTACKHGD